LETCGYCGREFGYDGKCETCGPSQEEMQDTKGVALVVELSPSQEALAINWPDHFYQKKLEAARAVEANFLSAINHASKSDWQEELEALNSARKTLRRNSMMRGADWFLEIRESLRDQGLIIRGAEPIADFAPESAFDQLDRKKGFSNLATGGALSVWSDRIYSDDKVYAIDRFTKASVLVEGTQQISQRPTLTRMALLSPLPGSALGPGLATAKKELHDLRNVVFTVASTDWAVSTPIAPARINFAHSVAARINATAERIGNRPAEPEPSRVEESVDVKMERLEKAGRLLKEGVITDAEFEDLKAKIFSD